MVITSRVFGVRCSYLVCIEVIRDVFRKTKNFDEKIFFAMKNLDFGSKFPKVVPAIMR